MWGCCMIAGRENYRYNCKTRQDSNGIECGACVYYHGIKLILCTAADLAGHVSLLSPSSMDCTRFVKLTMISKQYVNKMTTFGLSRLTCHKYDGR